MNAISGSFDEVGRANLTRDIVSTRVGADIADRYAPQVDVPRETVDNKIAIIENGHISQGQQIPVLSSELHGTHLPIHLELFGQLIEALNTGQADPMQSMPTLQAMYQHVAEHTEFASGEPALEGLVGQAKQVLQYGEEMINNTAKAMQKEERDAAQAQQQMTEEEAMMQQQQGGEQQEDPKMQAAQVQMQIMQQKAELEMAIKQQKHEQDQAIRDAEAAMKFQEDARS